MPRPSDCTMIGFWATTIRSGNSSSASCQRMTRDLLALTPLWQQAIAGAGDPRVPPRGAADHRGAVREEWGGVTPDDALQIHTACDTAVTPNDVLQSGTTCDEPVTPHDGLQCVRAV